MAARIFRTVSGAILSKELLMAGRQRPATPPSGPVREVALTSRAQGS